MHWVTPDISASLVKEADTAIGFVKLKEVITQYDALIIGRRPQGSG